MRRGLWLLSLLTTACLAKPAYLVTKTANASAKPPGCDFLIVTAAVDRPAEQLAILDGAPPASEYRQRVWAQDAASFKEAIKAQVCELGGDVVVAEVSGDGRYVRGTVLRWKEADANK